MRFKETRKWPIKFVFTKKKHTQLKTTQSDMQSNNNKSRINESQKVKLWVTQRARKLPLLEGQSNGKSNLLQGAPTSALIAGVLVSFA